MKQRGQLKTIRMALHEAQLVERFLAENPAIENFSALARIAILDLISKRGSIHLRPIVREEASEKPSFLWDYDMTDGEIREALSGPPEKRRWLVARIIERAPLEEVWRYLTPEAIGRDLPHLRLPPKVKAHWEYSLRRWKEKR